MTEKMDGECTTLYSDGLHARSTDYRHHASRTWLKAFHARIAAGIPEGWRLCGEYLFARHSIAYDALPSYFLLFSVWTWENCCLSWREMEGFAGDLGLAMPRVLYLGAWNPKLLCSWKIDVNRMEGYVVRTTIGYPFDSFGSHVAKWVRAGHVQTDGSWRHRAVVPNTTARQERFQLAKFRQVVTHEYPRTRKPDVIRETTFELHPPARYRVQLYDNKPDGKNV